MMIMKIPMVTDDQHFPFRLQPRRAGKPSFSSRLPYSPFIAELSDRASI
jgi:hypothetical protein